MKRSMEWIDETYSKTVFGFWVFLLADFMLFAAFFAVYAVLKDATFGAPSAKEVLNTSTALVQTMLLLTAAAMMGAAGVFAHRGKKSLCLAFVAGAFLLGLVFFSSVLTEFFRLVQEGDSWQRSAFLSAYFSLAGTHAVHIGFALLWSVVLFIPVWQEELTVQSVRRITCLRMFWQFLNIVWIFIFTIVYLGA